MKAQFFATIFTAAASASSAYAASFPNITTRSTDCESSVKLFAISDEFGKTGITNYHEGAGINYLFLTGSDSPVYTYNSCSSQIYVPFEENYKQFFNANSKGGIVQLTVGGPGGKIDVNEDEYLTLDGDAHGWVACKNTGDPYNYSRDLYQLAYGNTTFVGCKNIHIQVESE